MASARAGNVIGGGDWSEDRLIPDAVRAWQAGSTGRTAAASCAAVAARSGAAVWLPDFGAAFVGAAGAGRRYNFGPDAGEAVAVRDLVDLARAAFGEGEVRYGAGDEGPHEAAWLALEAPKAESVLGVSPRLTLVEAVKRTMAWYRAATTAGMRGRLCEAEFGVLKLRPSRTAAAPAKLAG